MQFFVGLARLEYVVGAIGVEKHADRVGGEFERSLHIFGRFCPDVKIVYLQFDGIPVGIGIIHRYCQAVIEADWRRNPQSPQPRKVLEQFVE